MAAQHTITRSTSTALEWLAMARTNADLQRIELALAMKPLYSPRHRTRDVGLDYMMF